MQYDSFLERAARSLAAVGAHVLARPDAGAPEWTEGWDQILGADGPGASTIYAFTGGDSGAGGLPERAERLARGLAQAGVLSHPVNLVLVTTFTRAPQSGERRAARRLAPSTYYQGLRPYGWIVDLERAEVTTGRMAQPDGADALRNALRDKNGSEPLFDPEEARRNHGEQVDAFRTLMAGRQPVVTYSLIAINVALFLLLYINGGPGSNTALVNLGALQPRLVEQGEWWRLFTSMFLHASIPHILFNMASLYAVGTLAERLYGSGKFLAIYLGSGLTGSLTSLLYAMATNNLDIVGVGASGAIFGVAGALVAVRFHHSDVIPKSLRDRISNSILPLVIISLVIAYLTPYVDNAAHIGGLLGGAALSFLFPLTRTLPETARWWS